MSWRACVVAMGIAAWAPARAEDPSPAPAEPPPAEPAPAPTEPPLVAPTEPPPVAPTEPPPVVPFVPPPLVEPPAPAPEPAPAPLPPGPPAESAWEALQRMPPRSSWDAGLHVSIGNIGYWREDTPPWVGFGLRGGWGRVVKAHRFGAAGTLSAEGPIPLYWSLILEPQATWDVVHKGLQVGASVGPALMVHMNLETTGTVSKFGVGPSVAGRIGYSEPWSRVGRRFFVYLEPKVRWIRGGLDWQAALAIGSGAGR